MANDPDEHLSVNIPHSKKEFLKYGKEKHGWNINSVVAFGVTVAQWFSNNASFKETQENLPRELLLAVRADLVKKGAKPEQLVNLDKAIVDYDEILRNMEKGEK